MNRLRGCVVAVLIIALTLGLRSEAYAARELLFDVQPVTLEGRALVPLRPIFEWLGARVSYEDGHIRAYRSEAATTPQVELWIGSTNARIVEADYRLHVAPQLINGRAFVPLRFVAESFGVWVESDGRKMRLSLPQEGRETVLAIPPHPDAHLGKIWRVIERWYDLLPPDEEAEVTSPAYFDLFCEEKQQQLKDELGEDAFRVIQRRQRQRPVSGIRILDGHVKAGGETGWAEVIVGYADGEMEMHHFEFAREPGGWRISGLTSQEIDSDDDATETIVEEADND